MYLSGLPLCTIQGSASVDRVGLSSSNTLYYLPNYIFPTTAFVLYGICKKTYFGNFCLCPGLAIGLSPTLGPHYISSSGR